MTLPITLAFLTGKPSGSGFWKVETFADGSSSIIEWHPSLGTQPSIEELEAAKHPAALFTVASKIKAERERRQLQGGFPVTLPGIGNVRFHSDTHSRSQHAGLYASAQLTLLQGGTASTPIGSPQVQWKTMDGTMVPLTVGVLLALLQASLTHEAAIHAAAETHIAAAALLDDPLTYDFSTGWPD